MLPPPLFGVCTEEGSREAICDLEHGHPTFCPTTTRKHPKPSTHNIYVGAIVVFMLMYNACTDRHCGDVNCLQAVGGIVGMAQCTIVEYQCG